MVWADSECSTNAARERHEQAIGAKMREAQDATTTAEYFERLVAEIHAKEPAAPIEGYVRGVTMEWCREQAEAYKTIATVRRHEEKQLRERTP